MKEKVYLKPISLIRTIMSLDEWRSAWFWSFTFLFLALRNRNFVLITPDAKLSISDDPDDPDDPDGPDAEGIIQLNDPLTAVKNMKPDKFVPDGVFPEEKRKAYLRLLWTRRHQFGIDDPTSSQMIAFRR